MHSYPSAKALGHAMVKDLLLDTVTVEEKVDGSQFSRGAGPTYACGKGHKLATDEFFGKAIVFVESLDLNNDYTYHFEYLTRFRHVSVEYERVPFGYLILLDIQVLWFVSHTK